MDNDSINLNHSNVGDGTAIGTHAKAGHVIKTSKADEFAELKRLIDELSHEIHANQQSLTNATELKQSVQEVQHALGDPNKPLKASRVRAVLTGIVDGAGKVSTVAVAAIGQGSARWVALADPD
jgi:hypothetical protein